MTHQEHEACLSARHIVGTLNTGWIQLRSRTEPGLALKVGAKLQQDWASRPAVSEQAAKKALDAYRAEIQRNDERHAAYRAYLADREAKRREVAITLSKTATAVLDGEDDVSTWSDAQLIRGTKQLIGRKPKVVPTEVARPGEEQHCGPSWGSRRVPPHDPPRPPRCSGPSTGRGDRTLSTVLLRSEARSQGASPEALGSVQALANGR